MRYPALLAFLLIFIALQLQAENINTVRQSHIGVIDLPGDPEISEGLAGSFAGVHNGVVIIAGGSNFPDRKPWEGGTRVLHDRILVGFPDDEGAINVIESPVRLPVAVSGGASATVPGGLFCIGGQTDDGPAEKTFLIKWSGSRIEIEMMPSLPVALRGHKASVIGNRVYVAGGESPDGPSSRFMYLDTGNPGNGWIKLPDMPSPLSDFMFAAQTDGEFPALWLIGGRIRKAGDKITRFSAKVFRYRPLAGVWERRGDIRIPGKESVTLAAGAAMPAGASHILVIGGDTGEVFNRVELAIGEIEAGNNRYIPVRDSLWRNHPGFSKNILAYNTITDVWYIAGEWEGEAPAVTRAISLNNRIVIPGGEIRPGIRTPNLTSLTLTSLPRFGWINYLVLALYFVAMLGVGFWFMHRGKDADDFFKAGGRIPWWAAGISIFATTLSAITFIAIPAKSYADDWRMLMFNICIIMIAPVVIRYFLPFFRRFNLSTAYEYLELRFSRPVRWVASGLFITFMVSRIAIVLFLPSLALHAVTGFSVYWSIILMGVITIIYCTSGGMEAVVWGDVIQGFILVSGALLAFGFMITGVEGGLGGFIEVTSEYSKFRMFDFSFDFTQPVFWVVMIGGLANSLILYTSDQSVVQRYMTTKNEKATARGIWLNGIISVPVSLLFFLLGTGLFAFYYFNPERLALTNPNIDATFPQFIVGELPAGIAGVLISAIFAAAMSTLSSNINSVSAVITSDFYKILSTSAGTRSIMLSARLSGIVVGVLGISMALMLATWDIASLWDQFNTFLGLLTGGLAALFIMGIFFRHISAPAALGGVTTGMTVLVWIQMNTNLSFLLYGAVGMTVSVAVAVLIAMAVPNKKPVEGYTFKTRKARTIE